MNSTIACVLQTPHQTCQRNSQHACDPLRCMLLTQPFCLAPQRHRDALTTYARFAPMLELLGYILQALRATFAVSGHCYRFHQLHSISLNMHLTVPKSSN